MDLPIDVAELVGLVCECLLYGIFITLFTAITYILIESRRQQNFNFPMMVNSLLLFGLATAQVAVDIRDIFLAFIDRTRPERLAFLTDTQPLIATKHSIFICQTMIGDLFVSYRCYIVWGRNIWAVMPPVALSLSSALCGFKAIWNQEHMASEPIETQTSWLIALFSLSLAANAVATALLAFRIWRVDRRASRVGITHTQNLRQALKLVAESGVLNAAYLFAFTMALVSGSAGAEIAPSIGTPLVGIIFSIVTIRVALNAEREANWIQIGNRSSGRHGTPSVDFSMDPRTTRFADDGESGLVMK